MRGLIATTLLLAGTVAAGQDWDLSDEPYLVKPLDFEVKVPEGWTAQHTHVGLVAHDADKNGFIVTREPFLWEEKTFEDTWRKILRKAEKTKDVDKKRVIRDTVWRAAWIDRESGRQIEVWRLYVEDAQMLYNFSFSAKKDLDLKPLVKDVLRSFKWTGEKPALKFQKTTESISPRIAIRLPEGYVRDDVMPGFPGLGRGIRGGFVKRLHGYEKPHVAGRIKFRGYDTRITYVTETGDEIPGTQDDDLLEATWNSDKKDLEGEILKRARSRSAYYGGLKGTKIEVPFLSKEGVPKWWLGFCGKHKQEAVEVVVIVDDRELRLHDDLLEQICDRIEVKD